MILSDIDNVIAMYAGSDTVPGQPIHRTFLTEPPELAKIRAQGIPLHVVTAKSSNEGREILRAVGIDHFMGSVVGAEMLLLRSVAAAVRRGRVPRSVSKRFYTRSIARTPGARVVMIEDRLQNLADLFDAGAIDAGILVPKITVHEGKIVEWFELDAVFRAARALVSHGCDNADTRVEETFTARRWSDGPAGNVDLAEVTSGGYRAPLLVLAPLVPADGARGIELERLSTGAILTKRIGAIQALRAGGRVVRRILGDAGGRPTVSPPGRPSLTLNDN